MRKTVLIRLLAALLLCAGLFQIAFAAPETTRAALDEDAVQMITLNIGKADCVILMAGNRRFMVDTGYEQTAGMMLTALNSLNIARLDGVFITHNDKDHVGGLARLLSSDVQVGNVYAPAFSVDKRDEKHPVIAAAALRGMEPVFLNAGEVLTFDDLSFTVLGPREQNMDNENNNSLVMTFSSPHGSILLTGDMKLEEEYTLLRAGVFTRCEVLKVPFHGDNSAMSVSLLNAVRPRMAVIPTSTEQEPDTPHKDTLRALASAGCETYVTQDLSDALLITLKDGKPSAKDLSWALPDRVSGLSMRIRRSGDMLYILNSGDADAVLNGATLFSTRGEDLFALPDGLLIPRGKEISVTSSNSGGEADVVLTSKKRIWHKSKYDAALLYDQYGRLLARTDNGLPE